ncbi:MAG TPA: serine hydrolase domain-containing protein [Chitinophagaceae bacterium]|nr:serine hydrolase domain-containing protein [Chitinophagaceae bacterium]
MNHIRLFLFLIAVSAITASCSSGTAGKRETIAPDSTINHTAYLGGLSKSDSVRYHDEVQDYYINHLLKYGFNGGILVAKNGHVVFEDYHGYFNLRKKDSLNSHSAFHIASVSKTFTAMATMLLVQAGKLGLDDDVKKFFPDFPYDGVQIKSLLSHRSGLPNYLYFMDKLGWNKKQYCSNQDVLDYLIKYHPPITSHANTHFEYCNTNYALLGLIIEKVSGMHYADFLQQQIFTPLHMNDTYVFSMADSARAMPSFDDRGRLERMTFLDTGFGDKNIYSTPEDLLKWDQALYTSQLFTKQTIEEAFTPYSNEKPGVRNYGYGWRMFVYPDGKKVIYHNGWWHGNNAVFLRLIQDSATIIVLGNKYDRLIYKAKDMAKIFEPSADMGEEEEDRLGGK